MIAIVGPETVTFTEDEALARNNCKAKSRVGEVWMYLQGEEYHVFRNGVELRYGAEPEVARRLFDLVGGVVGE